MNLKKAYHFNALYSIKNMKAFMLGFWGVFVIETLLYVFRLTGNLSNIVIYIISFSLMIAMLLIASLFFPVITIDEQGVHQKQLLNEQKSFLWAEIKEVSLYYPSDKKSNSSFYFAKRHLSEFELSDYAELKKYEDVILIRVSGKAFQAVNEYYTGVIKYNGIENTDEDEQESEDHDIKHNIKSQKSEINNDLHDIMKNQLKNEKILWSAKPKTNYFFQAERNTYLVLILFILFFLIFDVKIFQTSIGIAIYLNILVFIIISYTVWDIIRWFQRKKSTYFVITDKRVFDIFYENQAFIIHHISLNNIENFEVKKTKNGGNIFLSRYRNGATCFFDYKYGISDVFGRYNPEGRKGFRGRMNDLQFFSFFDLNDPDTPAQIIRERTKAKEYIDLDRRVRK